MDPETPGQVPAVSGQEPAPAPQVGQGEPSHTPAPENAEAAKYRTALRAAEKRLALLEADQKTRQDADLSDLAKAQKRAADLETLHAATQARARAAELRAAGLAAAGKLGVPADRLGLLVKLLQVDGGDVEFDDDGTPQKDSLDRVLRAILKEHGPALVPGPAPAEAPAPLASGQPTNAPRTLTPVYDDARLRSMTPEQINEHWAEISASLTARNGH